MKGKFLRVPKKYLLLTAGLVWFAAGFNICRIGLLATDRGWTALSVLSAVAVFGVFYAFIFYKLVKKHTVRICAYQTPKVCIFQFFDGRSYCIMACMMTFGILLRMSNLWPPHCIRMFYTGLGCALVAAGLGFIYRFWVQCVGEKRAFANRG